MNGNDEHSPQTLPDKRKLKKQFGGGRLKAPICKASFPSRERKINWCSENISIYLYVEIIERERKEGKKRENFPEIVVLLYEDDDEKGSERVAGVGLGGCNRGRGGIGYGFRQASTGSCRTLTMVKTFSL